MSAAEVRAVAATLLPALAVFADAVPALLTTLYVSSLITLLFAANRFEIHLFQLYTRKSGSSSHSCTADCFQLPPCPSAWLLAPVG